MTCDVCSKEIPRGQRYQGDKYKSLHFCLEDCFKKYCKIKFAPIFPRYIKPCMDFKETINRAKLAEIPNEQIIKIHKKKYEGKVDW